MKTIKINDIKNSEIIIEGDRVSLYIPFSLGENEYAWASTTKGLYDELCSEEKHVFAKLLFGKIILATV